MARLGTTCGRCGASIRLAVTDLRLLSSDAEADRCSFSCPLCGQPGWFPSLAADVRAGRRPGPP